MNTLEVRNLRLAITRGHGIVVPVDDVSFDVGHGEILGIAGESGSGKTLTLKSLIGLIPTGTTQSGVCRLDLDGNGLAEYVPSAVRGRGVSFVFQEPMSALNPTMRVGDLIAEGVRARDNESRGVWCMVLACPEEDGYAKRTTFV